MSAWRELRADVAIIGGGIIGCAIAYRLAEEKLSVTVIDLASLPGSEASAAAAGILSPQAEAGGPSPLLDLCLASRDLYPKWVEQLRQETGIDLGYCRSGLLYLAFGEEEERELEARYRWQSESGLAVEKLEQSELFKLEPNLSLEARRGLFFPNDHHIDNAQLTRALALAASRRGANFLLARQARGVLSSGGRAAGVDLGEEKIAADYVVNAAGCWAGLIDMQLGYRLPVQPARGQMVEVDLGLPPLYARTLYSREVYMVARSGGRGLIGSTVEMVGFDKSITVAGISKLLNGALKLVPKIAARAVVDAWAGLRPYSQDGLPVIGQTEMPGLIVATGHFRNGILLAPITAQIVAELIISGKTSLHIDSFSPLRFARRGVRS